jgi:cell division protein FtsI/penicillin-binding protein 2
LAELLGKHRFKKYIEQFGFGVKVGIELDTENTGTIASLSESKKEFDCYTATASFGQGLTVTPLQMVAAYSAIANGGKLMKPYIVDEIHEHGGKISKTTPVELRTVLEPRVSSLLSGMLVSVVDSQYGGRARVPGYHVAGKSGTAQISGVGGYTSEFNHSFIGFAPVEDPKYVMLVRYEKPEHIYAESTAAPVFGKISKFILDYYSVPPNRVIP